MIWILAVASLILINVLLLKFSCNDCEMNQNKMKRKINMPEKNDLIPRAIMADK